MSTFVVMLLLRGANTVLCTPTHRWSSRLDAQLSTEQVNLENNNTLKIRICVGCVAGCPTSVKIFILDSFFGRRLSDLNENLSSYKIFCYFKFLWGSLMIRHLTFENFGFFRSMTKKRDISHSNVIKKVFWCQNSFLSCWIQSWGFKSS